MEAYRVLSKKSSRDVYDSGYRYDYGSSYRENSSYDNDYEMWKQRMNNMNTKTTYRNP